jgi:hypothetical protein
MTAAATAAAAWWAPLERAVSGGETRGGLVLVTDAVAASGQFVLIQSILRRVQQCVSHRGLPC